MQWQLVQERMLKLGVLNSLFLNNAFIKEEIDMLDILESHETDMLNRYKKVVDSYREDFEKLNMRVELKLVRSTDRPSLVKGYHCSVACITHSADEQSLTNQNDKGIIAEWCISAITKSFFDNKINLFVDTSDAEEELDLYIKRASSEKICS